MTKTLKTRLGLYVTEKHDGNYYHVVANVVTLGLSASDRRWIDQGNTGPRGVTYSTIRNVSSTDLENGLYLHNLRINSQGEQDATERRLYGWDVEYRDVFSVDLTTAERMAKTLKTIRARMDKAEQKYGHPQTFGAYVARVADAIGAEEIIRPHGPQHGWSYGDNEQTRQTIRDGVWAIDHMVKTWTTARQAVSA